MCMVETFLTSNEACALQEQGEALDSCPFGDIEVLVLEHVLVLRDAPHFRDCSGSSLGQNLLGLHPQHAYPPKHSFACWGQNPLLLYSAIPLYPGAATLRCPQIGNRSAHHPQPWLGPKGDHPWAFQASGLLGRQKSSNRLAVHCPLARFTLIDTKRLCALVLASGSLIDPRRASVDT